jgi:D-glycero-alpha-D-manno-heptose 1-phosphate guanylyltransferase
MSSDVSAVILVGGKGTRIRALYAGVPKPMIQVRSQPFLYWSTVFLARAGVHRFVYSTGYLGEQIAAWCDHSTLPGLQRTTCHESEPLGTGGGLLNCLDQCGDWVLVANGDSLCLGGIDELLALVGRPDMTGGLIGLFVDDAARYGSLDLDPDGRLSAFREKVPGRGHINAGTYLFRTDTLRAFGKARPCSIEKDLLPEIIASGGHLQAVLVKDAPFIDIGTPETVVQADAFIAANGASFAWPV